VDEVGRLAVVLRSPRAVATGDGDHRQTFEAIMHIRIACEEGLGGVLRLVESSCVHQVDDAVRRVVEALILRADRGVRQGWLSLTRERRGVFGGRACCGGGPLGGRGGLVTRQTAALVFLAAAAGTRIIASNLRHHAWEGPLYTSVLTDAALFDALIAIDHDVAAATQAEGCRRCPGGRLHHGDYPRKPRGGPADLPAAYETRTSFCCARCRKRRTPPSVRFLGRRVYLGVVVLLACVLRQGPTPWRVARLRAVLGVSAETLARWHRWWRDDFRHTAFWRAVRSRFARPVEADACPRGLLERFGGDAVAQVVATLRFLGPLTTTSAGTLTEARP